MAEVNYAFIKDGDVINVAVFEDPTDAQLLAHFKNEFLLDKIVTATEKAAIGGTYDGTKFWLPQPYPSWIKNEELNIWESPTPYPTIEEGSDESYVWDENTTSWLLLPPA
jgi:hypothetical protein